MMSASNSPQGNQTKTDDFGDTTFFMANYAKEVLKMMQLMRQHHLLTDCILEVESELFHGKLIFSLNF